MRKFIFRCAVVLHRYLNIHFYLVAVANGVPYIKHIIGSYLNNENYCNQWVFNL